jgi:hypothetical protein
MDLTSTFIIGRIQQQSKGRPEYIRTNRPSSAGYLAVLDAGQIDGF